MVQLQYESLPHRRTTSETETTRVRSVGGGSRMTPTAICRALKKSACAWSDPESCLNRVWLQS